MATKSVMSAEDRAIVSDALSLKLASLRRSVNTEKDATVRAAREAAIVKVAALANRVVSGELEL